MLHFLPVGKGISGEILKVTQSDAGHSTIDRSLNQQQGRKELLSGYARIVILQSGFTKNADDLS